MLTGLTRNFGELVAIRFFLGLAEGPIQAATAMFLAQWFMKPERGRAFGIWNLSLGAGAFLAGPISGWILAHHDWRMMMVIEGHPRGCSASSGFIWYLKVFRLRAGSAPRTGIISRKTLRLSSQTM